MTNTIAVALGGTIVVFFGLDYALNDSDAAVFLGRKMLELIEWVAFWR